MAEQENIMNKGGRSKNHQDEMKTGTKWLQLRQSVVKNKCSSLRNDWNLKRNMPEQTAKETIEKCSQEVDQTESKIYRMMTRSENKNGRTRGLFIKK